MNMISSLLIANRGEIACRIIRTARRMGIRTVAVYSDADANALHVRSADEAVHIGPPPARESYLVGEKIIAAAKATGAEAIHPGYGFLSENAEFAQAVIDAGLVWVGPKPASITAMGLKDAAKALMQAAGVPVTPGYLGEDQSPARLQAEAGSIGYPVLIKAVAGGGGKGMRLVERAEDFADALASCKREASSSFGNDRVLIEKYIQSPRHIEVQVFGDSHGNVVHLFERDCSLQRRHQKVIEEAPAPGMDAATREAICAAAVRAAKAVDYEGAGTIEFIADASEGLRADRIWFMEMNTRLQVEHPVTEEITGVDLVEWQLRVASGEPIPLRQDELVINGHAIEARLYAENPDNGFLPSPGTLEAFRFAMQHRPLLDWTNPRFDTGVEEGDTIPSFYDPMIGKLIAHDHNRHEAAARLLGPIADMLVWPIRTNAPLLTGLLTHIKYDDLVADTGLLDRELARFLPPSPPRPEAVAWVSESMVPAPFNSERFGKFVALAGFRLNAPPATDYVAYIDGQAMRIPAEMPDSDDDPKEWMRFDGAGETYGYHGEEDLLVLGGRVHRVSLRPDPARAQYAHDGDVLAPMPGKVIAVMIAVGDTVAKGQKLLTLEAMKMEHTLLAPFDGTVSELNAAPGAQVQVEALLARIEAAA
jgi:3-methylcrotonyl-CoA carboxylase alpha subunit